MRLIPVYLFAWLITACSGGISSESPSTLTMSPAVHIKYLYHEINTASTDYFFRLNLDAKPGFAGHDFDNDSLAYKYAIYLQARKDGGSTSDPGFTFDYAPMIEDFEAVAPPAPAEEGPNHTIESDYPDELVYFRYADTTGRLAPADELVLVSDVVFSFSHKGEKLAANRASDTLDFTVP